MKNEKLEWAIRYLKFNMSVIPVGLDKKPLVDWKKYQTERADEAQIRKWFDMENPPNIGIVTGDISGITVVDVENGGKWEDYPVTMTSKTGNGGFHLFYKYAAGVQNKARIRELTDIRGEGGLVVVPPSKTHYLTNGEAKGGSYEWFRKEKVQPFPYAMFEVKPESKKEWDTVLKGVTTGSRNQTAAQVIGKFIRTLEPSEWMTTAWQMFVVWNNSNQPPLPEKELRTTFNSIVGRELRNNKDRLEKKQDAGEFEDADVKLISEIAKDITDDMSVKYPTGYKIIDEAFHGGMKEGDIFFITGYPGMGKTAFLQSMTYNLAKAGHPTLWFSFEVVIGELWRKFKDMGVQENFQAYAPERMVAHHVEWITKKIIEARDSFKTKVVFIDHLGYLEPKTYDKNMVSNLSAILKLICRQLKNVARDEGVVIVLAGHVRKPDKSNREPEPNYHDIADSGGPAQESDGIIIIHRRRLAGYDEGDLYEAKTMVKIEKNRAYGTNRKFEVNMVEGRLIDNEELIAREFPQEKMI